ncbi:MAG: nitronate monooxygenase, partial [Candidatus Omnitrophica bacterium]|nr:nitronate monooxygenase [Candidatus Omnitrophota bacterium]
NLRGKGLIAQDKDATYELVNKIRQATKAVLITKLSPNVTDITEIAKAAEAAGSDAVSLIITFIAMGVDIETNRLCLGAITGGLSGPAIKPVALRMVREVFNKIKIPVIGIGGIMDYKDALEFIICGASAVQVGTANFINPQITGEIIDGIKKYLKGNQINDIKQVIGSLKAK